MKHFLLCLILGASSTFAIPQLINYQGQLNSPSGTPLDTMVAMKFAIHEDSTGENQIWEEIHPAVLVTNGLFNVQIGAIDTLPDIFETDRWFEVTVGDDSPLNPMEKISSAAYSYRVGTVDGASGGVIESDVIVSGKLSAGEGNSNAGAYSHAFGQGNQVFGDHSIASGRNNIVRGNFAVVAGGGGPSIADSNSANGGYSAVGGGIRNSASGWYATTSGGQENSAGDYGTVGGGYTNAASQSGATVGGGYINTASANVATVSGGNQNFASNIGATVSGGTDNTASGLTSTVGGGDNNLASGQTATVGGGDRNEASSDYATVGGGSQNLASDISATVGGGLSNTASSPSTTVSGGYSNTASGWNSTIGGGFDNTASGDGATVGGGADNFARGTYSVVAGGGGGSAIDSNSAAGTSSAIGGGARNRTNDDYNVIGGGFDNSTTTDYATIAGGADNIVHGIYGAIVGGHENAAGIDGFVGGGHYCKARGNYSVVSGGGGGTFADSNSAAGACAMIPGGQACLANGNYSFAAGRKARALNQGSFVWGDGNNAVIQDSASNQFRVRASGGVWFYSNSGLTSGTRLPSGANAFTTLSDSTRKRNIRDVNTKQILDKITSMPVKRWSYDTQPETIEHIGPMAQDFWNAFKLGDDSLSISTIDPSGVALAAIQELSKRNAVLEAEVAELKQLVEQMIQLGHK